MFKFCKLILLFVFTFTCSSYVFANGAVISAIASMHDDGPSLEDRLVLCELGKLSKTRCDIAYTEAAGSIFNETDRQLYEGYSPKAYRPLSDDLLYEIASKAYDACVASAYENYCQKSWIKSSVEFNQSMARLNLRAIVIGGFILLFCCIFMKVNLLKIFFLLGYLYIFFSF